MRSRSRRATDRRTPHRGRSRGRWTDGEQSGKHSISGEASVPSPEPRWLGSGGFPARLSALRLGHRRRPAHFDLPAAMARAGVGCVTRLGSRGPASMVGSAARRAPRAFMSFPPLRLLSMTCSHSACTVSPTNTCFSSASGICRAPGTPGGTLGLSLCGGSRHAMTLGACAWGLIVAVDLSRSAPASARRSPV